MDTAGGTDNDLGAVLEGLHVVTDAGATDAGVALDAHEVANGDDDLLDLLGQLTRGGEDEGLARLDVGVDLLQNRDGEGGGLSGTGLGLSNDIVALDDGHDGALLNGRGALETVGVDTCVVGLAGARVGGGDDASAGSEQGGATYHGGART